MVRSQRQTIKDQGLRQPQEGEGRSKIRFNYRPWDLTEAEKYDMKVNISKDLSRSPYAAGFTLMAFVPKPTATFDTLTRFANVAEDNLYDMIEYAITCNEQISDWELHDYIIASGGMLPKVLQDGLWGLQRRHEKFRLDSEETQEYIDEIDYLV